MRSAVVLIALAASACWSSTDVPVTAPIVFSPPPSPTLDPPKYSVWEGRYLCSQGPTAMRLTISVKPDGTARVRFDFRALPENPSVPSGAYQLAGTMHVLDGGVLELRASPDAWLDQPNGYTMVGLRGESDPQQRTMKGRITHENCGELELTRVEPVRWKRR